MHELHPEALKPTQRQGWARWEIRIRVGVTDATHSWLVQEAERRGQTMSALVRELISAEMWRCLAEVGQPQAVDDVSA